MHKNEQSLENNQNSNWSKDIDRSVTEALNGIGHLVIAIGIAIGDVLKWAYYNYKLAIPIALGLHFLIIVAVQENYHLQFWQYLDPISFNWMRAKNIFNYPDSYHIGGVYLLIGLPFLTLFGLYSLYIKSKEEKLFSIAKLKNTLDQYPRIIRKTVNRKLKTTTLLIDPKGIGMNDFEARKDQLEGLFKLGDIEEIKRFDKDQSKIEITFSGLRLPTFISHNEAMKDELPEDHFIVGQSKQGLITQDISELPHMMIAGMTGSGKSVFFKQVLLSLLKSTPSCKMYLIDLKKGLEMSDFKDAPNIEIIKDIKGAVKVLSEVKEEMNRRFDHLDNSGRKKIIPEKDKMPRIILGIDECSVLYMKKNKGSAEYDFHVRATEITDDIAKLSRAAGIHLILATQKVTKETISTSIQDNIAGKVCFKMSGNNASVLVLGNKKAEELPQIRGRAIWHYGQEFVEFQAPFVSEKDIKKICKSIGPKTQDTQADNKVDSGQLEKGHGPNNKIQKIFNNKETKDNEDQ